MGLRLPRSSKLATPRHALRPITYVLVGPVRHHLAVAFYLGDTPRDPPLLLDQVTYHTPATRLLSGHGFSFATSWYPLTPAR